MSQDDEHLKLLSIFHYVVGGMACFFGLIPLLHVAIGLLIVFAADGMVGPEGQGPPAFIGWFFVLVGSTFVILGQAIGIAVILSGRFIARRTRYLYCLIVAGVECVFFPFGTVLGVFSIIVLSRDSVKQIYAEKA